MGVTCWPKFIARLVGFIADALTFWGAIVLLTEALATTPYINEIKTVRRGLSRLALIGLPKSVDGTPIEKSEDAELLVRIRYARRGFRLIALGFFLQLLGRIFEWFS